jgi:cytidylate kinase
MPIRKRNIEQIVEEQVQRWHLFKPEPGAEIKAPAVVTVSREPGSGGSLVAKGIAKRLEMDLFHQNVINEMAHSAKVSKRLLQSLDEIGLSFLEDWMASLIHGRYLWPDEYLQHLIKVIGTIGNHGNAVIVGRGANFLLPPKNLFKIRVIAPRDFRAKKVAEAYDIKIEAAKRRILKTESDRRAFVRKYFYEEIADPANYDLVINTGSVSIQEAVESVCRILSLRK